jgi:hypothetical protein
MAESSAEMSTLAARYMRMSDEQMLAHQRALGNFQFYAEIRKLAASVMRQDETKGQE